MQGNVHSDNSNSDFLDFAGHNFVEDTQLSQGLVDIEELAVFAHCIPVVTSAGILGLKCVDTPAQGLIDMPESMDILDFESTNMLDFELIDILDQASIGTPD